MKSEQAALFDRLAARGRLYAYSRESLERFRSLVPRGGRFLEVGCGDGSIGAALESELTVAFDISPRCAALARARGLDALVADAARPLPFADDAFDAVLCFDVLHHLPGAWDRVLAEFDRVLRRGGEVVIVEPDARNPFVRWTQAPRSPIRVAPCANEPAIEPGDLVARLEGMGYAVECRSVHIEGSQVERSVFPLWQRLLKAPFVVALALWYRGQPNKFAIMARKG